MRSRFVLLALVELDAVECTRMHPRQAIFDSNKQRTLIGSCTVIDSSRKQMRHVIQKFQNMCCKPCAPKNEIKLISFYRCRENHSETLRRSGSIARCFWVSCSSHNHKNRTSLPQHSTMPGLPIPRLILHHEAATMLCREHSKSDDEAEPLTGKSYIDLGFDGDYSDESSDEDSYGSEDPSSFSLHVDVETPPLEDCMPVSPLGVSSPKSDGPLHFSHDEVHAFGKSVLKVENTVRGAEIVAKRTIKGAERVARETAKRTGKVAKQTARETARVARKTAKRTTKVAKKTAKGTEKVVKHTANAAIGLPHELSYHWYNLVLLVALQALFPVAISLFTPATMGNSSVNAGLSQNRVFLYGTHTLMELFILAPFVSTCHYAIPDAKVPLESRSMAVLAGLAVGKLVLAFIAEAWWSPNAAPVFPIPYSFLVTMVFSIPVSLFALWKLTPTRKDPTIGAKIKVKFALCFLTLLVFVLALIACCAWAVYFRRLADKPLRQAGWGLLNQVMEFIFKILIAANLTTRLNGQRWVQLNLVIDLIFASVQTAMLPFFANWLSVTISVVSTILTIAWRSYAGVDRLQQFFSKAKEIVASSSGAAATVKGIGGLAAQLTTSPVKEVAPMSTRLLGNTMMRAEHAQDLEDIEAGGIERSRTQDTESLSDKSDSTESSQETKEGEKPKFDRREAFRNQKSQPIRNSGLDEVSEEQRHLFHIVDAVSSAVLITVVRVSSLITTAAIRSLPFAGEILNATFQISDDQWRDAWSYGLTFIAAVVLVILGTGVYLKKRAALGGLTLNRVIAYIFRDSYWFFFFWFCFTQHLSIALQLNHFGADLSLSFDWVRCRESGLMEWPGCRTINF